MNISEALSIVSSLRRNIESIDKAISFAEHPASPSGRRPRVTISVWVEDAGENAVTLDRDACIDLLRKTKAGYEAEIAKYQPVIDMANMALKGISP